MPRKLRPPRGNAEIAADDAAQEIALDAIELVRRIFVADRNIDENARVAALYEVVTALEFIQRTANRLRGLPGFPARMPGIALERLGLELEDLGRGVVGPMLSHNEEARLSNAPDKIGTTRGKRPPEPTKNQMLRAEAAASMQLLFLARGQGNRTPAAKEVAAKLKGKPILARIKGEPWRTIARWRSEIIEGATNTASQHYRAILTESDRQIEAMGADRKAALVKIAHDILLRLGKS